MLFTNINKLVQTREHCSKKLRGNELSRIPCIENAWLRVKNGLISSFGKMEDLLEIDSEEVVDLKGKTVLPTWVDSHTHLVFAASREEEFEMRLNGKSYEEIAIAGGGILNSAKKLQNESEDILFEKAWNRLKEIIRFGTGAVEIKSGYGLNVAAELKILRVVKRLKEKSPIPIKATFLGAHTFPTEFKENHQAYINLIINEMLPKIKEENLADYIDVFCEKVAFSAAETQQVIEAGREIGLEAKIHTNQFNSMGGIQTSVANNALSVDHLEVINQEEIDCLSKAETIATLLPTAPFFLNDSYPPARELLNANIPVALASDYNPGSSPSGNMNFVVSLACVKMRMTPNEAINAATINGAFAMNLENEVGSISVGKRANFIVRNNDNRLAHIPYSFGNSHIHSVYINGKLF